MKDELRCTWCGHENPPHVVECEKCGAPLKPVWETESLPRKGDAVPEVASALTEDEELRRWLAQFADEEVESVETAEVPEADETTIDEERLLEWVEQEVGETEVEAEDRAALEAWREAREAERTLSEAEEPVPLETPSAEEPPTAPSEAAVDWTAPLVGEGPAEEGPPAASEAEGAPEAAEAGLPELEPGEVPDWMASLVGESPAEEGPPAAPEVEGAPEAAEAGLPELEPGEVPDWMAPLVREGPAEEGPPAAPEVEGAPEGVTEDRSGETLGETPLMPGSAEVLLGEEELEALLEEAVASRPAEEAEEAQAVQEDQLPEWVRALRERLAGEDEGVVLPGEEEEEPLEAVLAGPLAGIPDVLPVEPRLTQMVQPTQPVLKLVLRKEERYWAKWLERLLQTEEAPGEAGTAVERPMPYWLWRLVVGLAFMLGLLAMLVRGWGRGLPARVPSPAVQEFFYTAQSVPPGGVVMVAVDYLPAWAPEISLAAQPALRLLEARQPYYLVLSTQPFGPGLAHALLTELGVPPERIIWLGYLPGGRAGLAMLARWPKAAFPPAVQGPNPWEHPALAQWQGMSDTAMLLVLTDQPIRAREWVEQVGLLLSPETPLVFVGSAGLGPVLEPYLGHPVRGWVSGFEDAQALAGLTGHPMPANLHRLWQGAMMLGLVLAMLSGVTLAVVHRIRRRSQ